MGERPIFRPLPFPPRWGGGEKGLVGVVQEERRPFFSVNLYSAGFSPTPLSLAGSSASAADSPTPTASGRKRRGEEGRRRKLLILPVCLRRQRAPLHTSPPRSPLGECRPEVCGVSSARLDKKSPVKLVSSSSAAHFFVSPVPRVSSSSTRARLSSSRAALKGTTDDDDVDVRGQEDDGNDGDHASRERERGLETVLARCRSRPAGSRA